jgi:TolB-like protein/Tfp pilus assembly protein PilF
MPTDTAPSHPVAAPPAMRADAARFGPFLLLPGEQRLLRDGTDVALSPRAMEVLQVLAERPGQLVTKDELLTRAWHGLVVEESNLHVQVSQIRKAIGTQWIATVPGLGYRLVPCEPRTDPEGAGPSRRALSVLVLPFVESAAPPEQAYFADAITDDVVAQLSRIRGCTVIASGTSFALRGEGADWAQAAREMGVRYALHGRIERDETGVEVIARLSDVATRAVIWSDRIEVDAAGVRQIRRELVSRLAAALDLELLFAEASRTGSRSPAEIRAHDLVMRARASSRSNWVRPDYLRALSLFEQALRLDPEEPDALAGRALALVSEAIGWPGPELPEQLARAEADALRALALDSTSREAHLSLSMVRQQQFRFDDALASAQTALELDPNFPLAVCWRGELHKFVAEYGPARQWVRRALRLSPRDPHRWSYLARLGCVELLDGDAPAAVQALEQSYALHPYWLTRVFLVSACVVAGRTDRLPEVLRLRHEEYGSDAVGNAWNRVSNHPGFLESCHRYLFEPIVRIGLQPDFAFERAWVDRQLRVAAWPGGGGDRGREG